ncbi:Crp/Fnr family transcriptional regulator [Pedobacter frigoris]|uniref:Crp/Fnr family transcriptional regulator n=1 Tax=Pedobacter frigoris TaxID=2571272 RepID=UPI00292F3797|nr:Crp/Fnr family transcriptional regulator [Pedobacter frigoris]
MRLPNKRRKLSEEIIEKNYQQLFAGFDKVYSLTNETKQYILEHSVVIRYRAKEVILEYGETCNYMLFCTHGLVSSNFIMEAEEKIVWFMGAGDPVVAVDSWYDRQASDEKLVALQESTFVALKQDQFDYLLESHQDFFKMAYRFTELQLQLIVKRTKWQQYSTEGKISNLEMLYPHLLQFLPNTALASYLGITRKTLSRIRNKRHHS